MSVPATPASAIRAILTLPMIVAIAIPLLIGSMDSWRGIRTDWGLVLVALGVLIVGWTVRDFFSVGRGTLAPWDPPRKLVTVGLFARVRNPMYIGVLTLIAGWAVWFMSPLLAGYVLVASVIFHVRVLVHEEPWAARSFPDHWATYKRHVPRWIPRLRAWRPDAQA